ncbi:MAG: C25 family cysteine peptidase [Bacteroidota bacterium]
MNSKKFFFIFFYFFSHYQSFAQLNNSWINFNQEYFKVAVSEEGIYRITFNELLQVGFPVSTINPQNLQLFYKGEERAIFVFGEADGVFNTNDYIEFYGTRNDGALDATMYDTPLNQTNPYVSLYTHQTFYYLTFTLDETLGKRTTVFDGTTGIGNPVTQHTATELIDFSFDQSQTRGLEQFFSSGALYPVFFQSISNQGTLLSGFTDQGKGFTDLFAGGNTFKRYKVPIENYTGVNIFPKLEVKITGRSNTRHNVSILAGQNQGALREVGNFDFRNYENVLLNEALNFNELPLSNDTFYVAYQINPISTSVNEIVSLSSIKLTYPQALAMGSKTNKHFSVPRSNDALRTITITGVTPSMRVFNLSDPNNMQELRGNLTADNNFIANIPGNNQNIELYVSPDIRNIDEIVQASISPINFNNTEYIIVTHKDLMRSAGGEDDIIAAYANYRASAQGGSYNVLTVDVENLYNQFTFGEVSPVAIRRFAETLLQRGNPEFLFFIGKGLSFNYNFEKNKPASLSWSTPSLIPCYGEPCSDNLFTAGFKDTFLEPAIATGRLPASTPEQVFSYLNKIKEHESFENDALWKKQFLHLSGGRTASEHRILSQNVRDLADYVREEHLGAKVFFKAKETTNTTEFIDISDEVNKGLSMMTFFGHSSLTLLDLEFGFVSNPIRGFENKARYPFLFMMGCNVGNVFTNTRSIGEDWILTPDKGAIGFLAHTYLAFADTQERYADEMYKLFFSEPEMINEPIGKIIQQATKKYIENNANNRRDWSNAQQFVLSCDPAVKIFNFDKPDYHIDAEALYPQSFDITAEIDSQTDSFQIALAVSNFGLAIKDTFEVSVRRTFPNGNIKEYLPQNYTTVLFKDTLFFTIQVTEADKLIGGGNNFFEVTVDAAAQIEEMDELNNTATLELFLKPKRMLVIAPAEFGIVSKQPVKMFAQNTEENPRDQNYLFQIDTTAFFNSPALRDTSVIAGLTPFWETTLLTDNQTDSLVYYWRVRPAESTETDWSTSSFVYIKNSPNGWSQSHPQQFSSNSTQNIIINELNGNLSFEQKDIILKVQAVGGSADNPLDYSIFMNDFRVAALGICDRNVIISVAIDQFTGIPYIIPIFPHLRCGFGERGDAYRLLDNDLRNFNAMSIYMDFINEGDYVLLVAAGNVNFDNFTGENYAGFAQIGIDADRLLNTLTTGDPYIAFGRKGTTPGSAQEVFPRYTALTPSNQQIITGEFAIDLNTLSGNFNSPRIGPASNWTSFFQLTGEKDQVTELANVDVIGVKIRGEETVLRSEIEASLTDLSFIDSDTFPYLRLRSNFRDTLAGTPVQLKDWKVIYDAVPEGILFKNTQQSARQGNIAEGDSVQFQYYFSNVSGTSFEDSLVVSYDVINQNTNQRITRYDTLGTLAANDSVSFSIKVPTKGIAGTNTLNVFVNPRLLPEQIYENNIQEEQFIVSADTINPLLDVLFDGIRIMDGDIVAPSPLISINIKDENRFLIKNDTSGIEIFLNECDSCTFRKIALNSPNINWVSDEKNNFQLFYQPEQLADGRYTLMVQGTDDSGNAAGIDPYSIRFEVINEARVSNFYPYPNPFSDRVRFVFTLTGSEIPSGIKIQIMTVSGRVVREITQDELGPIRIGNNLTEYAWNGKDEFGDQLANGVYLYRVLFQSNDPLKPIETAADHMFKNGYGKMYLMR